MKKFALIMFAFLFAFALPFSVVGCDNTGTEQQQQQEQEDDFVYENEVKYNYIGYTCQRKSENECVYVFELRVENNTRENFDLVKSDYQAKTQYFYIGAFGQSTYYWENTTFHIYVGAINQNEILVSTTLQSRSNATLFIATDTLVESRTNAYDYNETLKKVAVIRGTEVIDQISHNS